MSDTEIQTVHDEVTDKQEDQAPTEVEVVEIVEAAEDRADPDPEDDEDDEDVEDDEDYERAAVVLLEVLERQLIAGQELSTRIVDATTDAAATFALTPATVIAEVRAGATLPDALDQAGAALQDAAAEAGSRIRAAVGSYVNSQSALPNAVITGAADVAVSVVRAQGAVTVSAVDTAFTIATVATRGGDIRDAFEQEWRALVASTASARDSVDGAIEGARHNVQVSLPLGNAAG